MREGAVLVFFAFAGARGTNIEYRMSSQTVDAQFIHTYMGKGKTNPPRESTDLEHMTHVQQNAELREELLRTQRMLHQTQGQVERAFN